MVKNKAPQLFMVLARWFLRYLQTGRPSVIVGIMVKDRGRQIQDEIGKISLGLLKKSTDLVLFMLYLSYESASNRNYFAGNKALKDLEKFNSETFFRAISQLKRTGMVVRTKGGPVITQTGRNLVEKLLPSFVSSGKRNSGEIYLLTYDINENYRHLRKQIRRYAAFNKMIPVQQSVYLAVKDPFSDLEKILVDYKDFGQVLITKLGKDSVVGGEGLPGFLQQAYHLDKLSKQYESFISWLQYNRVLKENLYHLDFQFNLVYKDDPQIPDEFLPVDWAGQRAWRLYQIKRAEILRS